MGDDPGPAKLEKARGYNIPLIEEDQLLDLILEKSGLHPRYSKITSENSCDSGKGHSTTNSFDDLDIPLEFKKVDNTEPNLINFEIKEHPTKKKQFKESVTIKQKQVIVELKENLPKVKDEKIRNQIIEQTEVLQDKEKPPISEKVGMLSWTDKYKPRDLKHVIGQQDSTSNMNKLCKWLKNWYRNQQPDVRKSITKPSPWAKNDDGAYYKAALLSGPPGVGKPFFIYLLILSFLVYFLQSIVSGKFYNDDSKKITKVN